MGALSPLAGTNQDQLIFLQVAKRFRLGQAPYSDFWVPQGPIAGWFLSWPLRFLSPGWSLVFSSACLNALLSMICFSLLRIGSISIGRAFLFSCFSSVSFLIPFGGFYNDHLAYALVLVAFLLYRFFNAPVLTGFFFALSYHSKQTVGGISFLVFLLTVFLYFENKKLTLIKLLLSFFTSAVLILILFGVTSSWENYYHYSVLAPLWYKASTHTKDLHRLGLFLVFPWLINPIKLFTETGIGRLLFFPTVLICYISYYHLLKFKDHPLNPLLFFSLFSTLLCSSLLGRYYGHLFLGMGVICSIVYNVLPKQKVTTFFFTFLILGQITLSFNEWANRWKMSTDSSVSSLHPIRMEKGDLLSSSLEIIDKLGSTTLPIAVLGTNTYLLGVLTDSANTNPNIYYQKYLTFPMIEPYRNQWEDQWILKVTNTPLIIVDKKWLDYYQSFFPKLNAFIRSKYQTQTSNDFFVLYVKI